MEGRLREVRVPLPLPLHRPRLTAPHRLGQEPPPQPQEDVYDGRSLAEVCPPFSPAPAPIRTLTGPPTRLRNGSLPPS